MIRNIKLIIIDVDGTMTDGGIYYDDKGNEFKKFCSRDAAGFFAAQHLGIKIMVLTGRGCAATKRRMSDLNIDLLFQNVKDKAGLLKKFMEKNHISKEEVAYIGDDLNDLLPMRLAGFIGCPQDSCREIKDIADYISEMKGGNGAVRDIIEFILRESGKWNEAVLKAYGVKI